MRKTREELIAQGKANANRIIGQIIYEHALKYAANGQEVPNLGWGESSSHVRGKAYAEENGLPWPVPLK